MSQLVLDLMRVEEFEENIVLIGVDYIGGENLQPELAELIDEYRPASVGLALCEKRFETMEKKEEWLDQSLLSSYKGGEFSTIMYQLFVDSVRENLKKFKRLEPETHIVELMDVADYFDTDIEFIDRDITVTLKRTVGEMSFIETFKTAWYFKSAMLSFSDKKKEESVEEIKEYDDIVEGVLSTLQRFSPAIAKKARKERVEYMAKKTYERSKEGKILAIIPESKIEVVLEELKGLKSEEKDDGGVSSYIHLEKVGEKIYSKILKYGTSLFFILLAIYLFFFSDVLNIWRAWIYWFISIGGMASLGALIGKGHILSILTSFVLAPFMSLTLHGPGYVAGYVEARIRNPKIKDLQNLTRVKSINEFLSNNLIRPVMVGIFSNIFTLIGLFVILPLLISLIG